MSGEIRRSTIVPCRFDESPPDMGISTLRDATAALAGAAAVFRRNDSDVTHQLRCAFESSQIADLGHERRRGQDANAAQGLQGFDQRRVLARRSKLSDLSLEALEPRVELVDRPPVFQEDELLGRLF